MYFEAEKIKRSMEVLQNIAQGINPLSGEQVQDDSFLKDARMVSCFGFAAGVLDNMIKRDNERRSKELKFVITAEQKGKISLPEGKIGVNEFSKRVNECINQKESKRLTGVELNRRLRKMGVLGEQLLEEGKIKTITNEKSAEYGFEMERKKFNGVEYDMVLINNTGKKYLLDNLESIMAMEL